MKSHISKLLEGTISESEIIELNSWLKDSKNKSILEAYIKDYHDLNLAILENNIDEAFKNVTDKIENTKTPVKVLPFYKKSFFKYAAVMLLFLSAGYFYLDKINQFNNTPIIVNNNIEIGTDKATLTLGDGTNITLEKGLQYISQNIESNGEKIIYKSSKKTKPEIAYNYLTIPRGGQYHLYLSDGTQVWLNSESKLKYPTLFIDGEIRNVELVYGEAYFVVSSSTKHNGAKFKVLTKTQDVEVLGTEFNIKAYNNENAIYTTLVEGKVAVSNGNVFKVLKPEQQSIINQSNSGIAVNSVDIFTETSWKRGVFSFKGKPLKEIFKVLSRWYDFDFIIENKNLNAITFKGVLGRNQNIEEVMSAIKNSSIINNYEIHDKTITIK
ncbi:FecR family protein [Algibacter sp. Ld11]|uniref:FecR family protein n=1 Tax=Algibacter sp. Ld11 TaxID=649150 RepID=UPI003864D89D